MRIIWYLIEKVLVLIILIQNHYIVPHTYFKSLKLTQLFFFNVTIRLGSRIPDHNQIFCAPLKIILKRVYFPQQFICKGISLNLIEMFPPFGGFYLNFSFFLAFLSPFWLSAFSPRKLKSYCIKRKQRKVIVKCFKRRDFSVN